MALVALVLLYLATAVALAAVVRAAGWRFSPVAALVLALLPLVFTGQGFLPRRTLAPSLVLAGVPPWVDPRLNAEVLRGASPPNPLMLDPATQIVPWDRAARDGLLFNPAQGAGAALLGNGQSAVLFPTDALARLLPPFRAVTYRQAARLLIAAWGMFVLVRLLGCCDRAGVAAAAAFVGAGFLQLWRLHPHANVAATAPWMVAAAVVLLRRPGPRAASLLGAAGAIGLFGGHPETLLHVALFAMVAAPVLARVERGGLEASTPTWRSRLAWAACSGILAFSFAAPALLPLIENLRYSTEWNASRDERRAHLELPLDQALERLRPAGTVLALGDPRRGTWQGPENLPELGGAALGAPALFLAAMGFAADRRRLWPLLVLGLIGVLVSAHVPLISTPFTWVPLLRDSLLTRLGLWWALAGSILAGAGTAALCSRRLGAWTSFGAALAVAAVVTLAQNGAPLGEASRIRALEWGPFLLALLALPLVVVATAHGDRSTGARLERARAWIAGLVVLVALVAPRGVLFARWIPVTPAAGFYPPTPATEVVADRLAALPEHGYRVSATGSALTPHSAAFFGFGEIRFYDPLTFAPYAEFLGSLGPVPRTGWVEIVRPTGPVLDYLGVRFLFDQPASRLQGPNALLHSGEDAVVWERDSALPRAFFPRSFQVEADPEAAVGAAKQVADFANLAILTGGSLEGGANPEAEVLELTVGRGDVGVLVHAAAPALLVTSQPAIPGWRLEVDGEPAPDRVCRVNGAFLGAVVPAGTHRLDFRYRPLTWRIGLTLAAGALLGATFLLAADRRGRRRSQGTPPSGSDLPTSRPGPLGAAPGSDPAV